MPGNIAAAAPSGVLPKILCSAFTESRQFPMLAAMYHDGTTERGLIEDGVNAPSSIRTWKIGARLTAAQAAALLAFFEGQQGGLVPFYFYNPFEAVGAAGSNWDATGNTVEGRHTVRFTGSWSQTMGVAIADAPVQLAEIA